MSLPETTTVLIVGAGPTGLAAALSLTHHGCRDFVIVDAVLQGENTSRAIVVHAATLEALDSIGCGPELVERGVKAQAVSIRTQTSELVRAHFSPLINRTPHPYGLFIPQNITEQVLGQKLQSLGVQVHRPKRLVGMKRNERDSLVTDVLFDDGSVVQAKYVIGADGARSTVRTLAGIGFFDPDGEVEAKHNLAQMVLADVIFKSADIPRATLAAVMSPESFFICAPFPTSFNKDLARSGQEITETIFRIGCGVPLSEGPPPSSPPREYLQDLVDRFGPDYMSSNPSVNPSPFVIDQVVWSTRFRTHSAIADRTFTRLGSSEDSPHSVDGGVILLVGDAAHIHSPAGGQGMNLGIRDAVFLGEVVAKHIKISASQPPSVDTDAPLRDFAAARHARALEVIGFTKSLLKVAGAKYDTRMFWWLPISFGTIRDWALWTVGKVTFVQGKLAWNLSGLGRR